ncbi:MAG: hypothetical protein R2860_10200 [Desulfobacterales bacterium]
MSRPSVFTDTQTPGDAGRTANITDLLIDKYNDPGEETLPITRKTKPGGRMSRISQKKSWRKIEHGVNQLPLKQREKRAMTRMHRYQSYVIDAADIPLTDAHLKSS